MAEGRKFPKTTRYFKAGAILAFGSSLLVIIAFASPYWLESYQAAHAEFVRLGLWEACFRDYRHPPYQYDEKFHGCHWLYSYTLQNIRDWLQPGWFMFVQAMVTLSIVFLLINLSIISVIHMRYWLKYEVYLLSATVILEGLVSMMLFLAVSVFGGMCFDRSWLQYPMFNHLSWSYAFAMVGMFLHASAAGCLLYEVFKAKERRRRANNLVHHMNPRSSKQVLFRDSVDNIDSVA